MDFRAFLRQEQQSLEAVLRLPEFALVMQLNRLYAMGAALIRADTLPLIAQCFMLARRSLLSAASTLARGHLADAAVVTRRLIEMGEAALAFKLNRENVAKWEAGRMPRWDARAKGAKPPRLQRPQYDPKPDHPYLKRMRDL